MPIPTKVQLLRSLDREIQMRQSVYPGRVAKQKMKPDIAEREISYMRHTRMLVTHFSADQIERILTEASARMTPKQLFGESL